MTRVFGKALRNVARPALEKRGYRFNGRRRFVKKTAQGEHFVIEYQLGVRGLQGKFTVNLIHGDTFSRMRMVKPTRLSGWVNRLLGHHDPWWKGLFLPKDRWWKMSPLEADMNAVVEETVNELEAYGIAWLENPGHNTQR